VTALLAFVLWCDALHLEDTGSVLATEVAVERASLADGVEEGA